VYKSCPDAPTPTPAPALTAQPALETTGDQHRIVKRLARGRIPQLVETTGSIPPCPHAVQALPRGPDELGTGILRPGVGTRGVGPVGGQRRGLDLVVLRRGEGDGEEGEGNERENGEGEEGGGGGEMHFGECPGCEGALR
jgi:hypothetical protein